MYLRYGGLITVTVSCVLNIFEHLTSLSPDD